MCYDEAVSKPILNITIETVDAQRAGVRAVFDSGSHFTLVRESILPPGTQVLKYAKPKELRTASRQGRISVTGATQLVLLIGERMIQDDALICPDLGQELLVGAGTMQKWDVTIRNDNGHTSVEVGLDLRDPDITEVD